MARIGGPPATSESVIILSAASGDASQSRRPGLPAARGEPDHGHVEGAIRGPSKLDRPTRLGFRFLGVSSTQDRKRGQTTAAAAVRFATRQEEAETAVTRTLGFPGPGAPDITPTCHGIPADAGAGGHEMFVVDGREAGLGPSDQDCGESPAARQTAAAERQSAAARQATEWGVDGSTAGHGERKFYGGGAWRSPPGRSHERPESRLRHAAFRRWVRGSAPHPRRCACPVSVSGASRLAP